MYSTIVVGTDGSQTAVMAVERAAALAAVLGSRLVVLHAYQPGTPRHRLARPHGSPDQPVAKLSPDEEDVEILADAKQLCVEAGVKPEQVETRTAHTGPAVGLLDLAVEIKAELIVMGSRRLVGPKRFLLGSVSQQVTDHAPCDVTIVVASAFDGSAPQPG